MNNVMKKFATLEKVSPLLDKAQKIVNEITQSTMKFAHYTQKVAEYCDTEKCSRFTLRTFSKTRFSGVLLLVDSVVKSKTILRHMAVDSDQLSTDVNLLI